MSGVDPRRGLTRRRNARSPLQTRALAAVSAAIERLGLVKLFFRGVVAGRRRWAPTWRTRAFAGYTPTCHDVLVCTYTKSGTNLMLQMVHQIAHLGEGDLDHIHDVAPWPDGPHLTGATLDDGGWLRSPVGLRAIKTHLEADHVPWRPEARYVVVLRSPGDTLASGYYFVHSVANGFLDHQFTWEEWLELSLADRSPLGSWAEHTASWWRLRGRGNVLFLTYEQITRDLDATVRQVAAFLGVTLSDEVRARVIERCGFSWMKAHEAAFRPPFVPLPGRAPAVMVRSGRSGDGARLLPEEALARLDAHTRRELQRLGSDFPYARLLAGEPVDASIPATSRRPSPS
ncbi:MAG: sulfotransferase domain-containing protein [Nannocystaceae bacterium]